jgi:hypothetical protein
MDKLSIEMVELVFEHSMGRTPALDRLTLLRYRDVSTFFASASRYVLSAHW